MKPVSLLACSALAACTLSEPVLKIPVEGARSVVTISVGSGGVASATAFSTAREDYISHPLVENATLYVLRYRCDLSMLEIFPGRLRLADTGRPLPVADTILKAELAGGTSTALEPASADELADVRLEAPQEMTSPCVEFEEPIRRTLGPDSRRLLRFLVEDRENAAFGGLFDGTFFHVLADGTVEQLTSLSTATPSLGARRGSDGEMWVAGAGGATAHGDPRTGFQPGPPMAVPQNIGRIYLDGPDPGSGETFELFAVTSSRTFQYFDGTRWTLLHQTTGEPIAGRAGVAWIRRGEAIAVGLTRDTVLYAHDGAVAEENLPLDFGDRPVAIARTKTFGLVAGTEGGRLIQRIGEGRWQTIADTFDGQRIHSLAALGDGVVFAQGDALGQFHAAAMPCPTAVLGPGEIIAIVPFASRVVLGSSVVGQDDLIQTLVAKPPANPHQCSGGTP